MTSNEDKSNLNMLQKLGWQRIAVGAMLLLVIVIFVLVAIKFTSTPTTNTPINSSATNSGVISASATLIVLPTVGTDPRVDNPVYGVVVSKALNVRSSPSTTASVISSLQFGQVITLVKRNNSWYQTDSGGWVSALYIEVRQTLIEAQAYSAELTH